MTNFRQIPSVKLEQFAKEHRLKLTVRKDDVQEKGEIRRWKQIEIGDHAWITDPVDHPMEIEMCGSAATLRKALRESGVKKPLNLFLSVRRMAVLYDLIGFDLSSYMVEQGGANGLNLSTWGAVLYRVGFRYWDGDDEGVALLFCATDKAQAALALALAKIG